MGRNLIVTIVRRRQLFNREITYRWRVQDGGNYRTLAHGGQGYSNLADCADGAAEVLGAHVDAMVGRQRIH